MVEIGRENDISSTDIAGSAFYQDADIIRTHQKHLISLVGKISMIAVSDHSAGHIYRVKLGEMVKGVIFVFWPGTDLHPIFSRIRIGILRK